MLFFTSWKECENRSRTLKRWEWLWKLLFLGVVIWIVDLAPYFSHPTGTSAILNAKATIPDKSSWEGCTQLNLVHFNPQKKRVSSFAKYPRTITRTNVKLFLDIGPGAGEGRKGKKKTSKVAAWLSNTFDDDCKSACQVLVPPINKVFLVKQNMIKKRRGLSCDKVSPFLAVSLVFLTDYSFFFCKAYLSSVDCTHVYFLHKLK